MRSCIKYKYKGKSYLKGDHPLYRTWYGMHRRCNDPNYAETYKRKGIKVCPEWEDFQTFLSDMGERPEGLSLERTDNTGNYTPDNCVWADWATQGLNKDNTVMVIWQGNRVPLTTLGRDYGIDGNVLNNRVLRLGWSLERALTQPVRPRKVH